MTQKHSPMQDNFWDIYSGNREILGHALFNHDPFDQFAWCQGWRFALADYLTWELGEDVPEFRSYGPDTDSFEFQELMELGPNVAQCEYALKILDRFRVWLGLAGEDY